MNEESKLRERARDSVRGERLPNRRPDRTWGGPGMGVACVICGAPVKHDEMGYEIEFSPADADSDVGNYHLHVRCFAVWESEREMLERDSVTSPG
jgi:hypothetical protein